MGRITSQVVIENALDPSKRIDTHAMVDTGATYLTLPMAWRDKLGEFPKDVEVALELADQSIQSGKLCGPVRVTVDKFQPIYTEVMFVPMQGGDGDYEPLLGYHPLEGCRVAVDMLGHRLVPLKYVDLK